MGTASPAEAAPAPHRRWPHVLAGLALVLAIAAVWLFGHEPRYAGALVHRPARTLVFAHRGFGNFGPDNSLYAVERALAAGADGVDMDGQRTRDSALVIFHDLSVDRLTSDTGRVRDKTLAQMLALDLGPKFDRSIRGASVHTFEDFLRAVQGHGILMVELKVPGPAATGIEQLAVDVIRRHGAYESVVLSSFNPIVLYRVKRLDPRVLTALIFMDTNWNPELLAEIKPGDAVNLPWPVRQEFIRRALRKLIRPDLLSINHEVPGAVTDRLIAKGWAVFIWTPDEERDIRHALARHPYGVISNQPVRARALRDAGVPPATPASRHAALELLGVSVFEPDVALTDLALAGLGAWLAWRLRRGTPDALRRRAAMMMAFLASAALWGAIFHAFFPDRTTTPAGFVAWMPVAFSILVVAATLLELGLHTLAPRLPPAARGWIVATYAALFAAVVLLVDESYVSIVRFYAPTIVLMLAVGAREALRGSAGWATIALSFVVSGLAALLQQAGVGIGGLLGHNVVYHVLQGVALVLLYQGFQRATAAPAIA